MATELPRLQHDYPLLADVSFYQKDIDFHKMKASGIVGVFIRAGQKNWTDPYYHINIGKAKEAGLLRGTYWFLDTRDYARDQARKYGNLIKDDPGEIRPVVDIEESASSKFPEDKRVMIDFIREFIEAVEGIVGKEMIIYTSPNVLKNYFGYSAVPSYMTDRDLWIAHYYHYGLLEKPAITPFETWRFWQFTTKLDGISRGVSSYGLDGNYFNGTYQQLLDYLNVDETESPELTDKQKLDILWQEHLDR